MSGEVNIVLVEDNPSDAELIMRVFRKHKVANNIVVLKDGVEALDFLFGKGAQGSPPPSPSLIVLDLKLPKVNGLEVLRRIKSDAQTRDIPIVVLTSSREERDVKDAYAAGVNSYVTKPIKFADFAKVVADLEMYWLLLNTPPVRQSPPGGVGIREE